MDEPSGICPSCNSSGLINGACPVCGYSETGAPRANTNPRSGPGRVALWAWFWSLFLGTPVLGLLTAARGGGLMVFGIGTIAAGFVLSRLFTKNDGMFFVLGIVFSVGIFAVYFGIAFVGCLAMMKGSSF